jgi:hypothetical protein
LSQPKETIVVCSLVDVYCYEFLPRASFEWLGSKEDLAFLFCIAYDWLNGSVIRQLAGDFRFYGITGQHFDLNPQASTTSLNPQASTTSLNPQASTTSLNPQASTTSHNLR